MTSPRRPCRVARNAPVFSYFIPCSYTQILVTNLLGIKHYFYVYYVSIIYVTRYIIQMYALDVMRDLIEVITSDARTKAKGQEQVDEYFDVN